MDTSRKICTVLTEGDLSPENIKTTVKTIEHNPNKFYLLETGNIWEVVEKLSKSSSDDNLVTRMRIAYNLKFDLKTVLKAGDDLSIQGNEVKNFAELLELLDFDDNLNIARTDYHVIINDDNHLNENAELANRAVAKLFQQAIFLSIVGLDIQKKSEIHKTQVTKRFREHYGDLKKEIESNEKLIRLKLATNPNFNEDTKRRAEDIIASFETMLAEFAKAKKRPIRIAAMGTKKAGKSVVINSLLQRDYAPTSAVLPTPNTIKYIPDDIKKLKLDYNGKSYEFDTADELKEYIGEEFKQAQKGSGEAAALEDMTVHYPCPDLKGLYEIWDTPGPNYAGAGDSHRRNAQNCIAEADVCIFVMNYSNYLTDDEVNFLKEIHKTFQENNKFYSLLMTVNRIDERYAVSESKSVDRILDYIGYKLEQLNYKNIVVFGTSALQHFYLDDVVKLAAVDGLPVEKSSMRPLKRNHKDAMTQIKFIDDAIGNLQDFHDIENPTDKELRNLSGIPQLWQYAQYIGGNKADMEIVDHVVGICDTSFAKISNDLLPFIVKDFFNLNEKDKINLLEFAALIGELKNFVDSAIVDVRKKIECYNVGEAISDASEILQDRRRRAKRDAVDRGKNILNNAEITADDVKAIANNRNVQPQNLKELNEKIGRMIFAINADSVNGLDKVQKATCDKYIVDVENTIRAAQIEISQQTEAVKKKVIETIPNATAKNIINAFKKPDFPPAIDRLNAENRNINASLDSTTLSDAAVDAKRREYETRYRTEYRLEKVGTRTVYEEREASGLWENIRSFFGKTYYNSSEEDVYDKKPYQVPYQVGVDVYDVGRFKREIAHELQERIITAIENAHDKMDTAIKENIRKIFSNVKTQSEKICDGYNRIYSDFQRDVDMAAGKTKAHQKALEADLKALQDIADNLKKFIEQWNTILHGDAKR